MPSAAQAEDPNPDRRHTTDEEARALASALRLDILHLCIHLERSNREIAQILDRHPASGIHLAPR
jgi:hypothetical protein